MASKGSDLLGHSSQTRDHPACLTHSSLAPHPHPNELIPDSFDSPQPREVLHRPPSSTRHASGPGAFTKCQASSRIGDRPIPKYLLDHCSGIPNRAFLSYKSTRVGTDNQPLGGARFGIYVRATVLGDMQRANPIGRTDTLLLLSSRSGHRSAFSRDLIVLERSSHQSPSTKTRRQSTRIL